MGDSRRIAPLLIIVSLLVIFHPTTALPQIVRDSSLGTMKNQPLVGPNYAITPDLGVIQGPNLFHSFSQFNVNTLPNGTIESATFSGPATIGNILTRVTGPSFSTINGSLRSTIPGANLYLLNPRGVLFGANASLNIGGAFYVSTADFVRFTDGARFFTNLSQASTLTSAPIVAFGFLGPTVNPVVFSRPNLPVGPDLAVGIGQTLSVIAGDIQMTNTVLRAPSGIVQIASVASAGEVIPISGPSPNLILEGFSSLGTITLLPTSIIETTRLGGQGGTVLIRGGHLIVDHSGLFSNTLGSVDGASIGIDIHMTKDIVVKNSSQIASLVNASGSSGDIRISGDSVEVNTGSVIRSSAVIGSGKPGDITVTGSRVLITGKGGVESSVNSGSSEGAAAIKVIGTESVKIIGEQSHIASSVNGVGNAGQIFVSAPLVELRNGGSIQATIVAGTGLGGHVEIQGQHVLLADGAQIVTNAIGGGLGGGPVTITATESITVTGKRVSGTDIFESLISTSTEGSGPAGAITLTAPTVTLSDLGGVRSEARSGQGDAGTINIHAAVFTQSGGSQIRNTTLLNSSGKGGTINIVSSDSVTISGQSTTSAPSGLFTDTSGSGIGGNITVAAPTISVLGGAVISSSSTQSSTGNAGSVTLQGITSPTNTLLIADSSLLTSAQGNGSGGNLLFSAEQITLQNANISATASGSGKAGSIALIDAQSIMATSSSLTTEANLGAGGTITLTAKEGGQISLTATLVSATVLGGDTSTRPPADIALRAPTITLNNSIIQAETGAAANAGSIEVSAGTLTATGGTAISTTANASSTGNAGRIIINGLTGTSSEVDSIMFSGATFVHSDTFGSGNAGSVEIHVRQLTLSEATLISTTTAFGTGNAGDITIAASDFVRVTGIGPGQVSGLLSQSLFGGGNAGRVTVTTPTLTLGKASTISTSNDAQSGPAGDILLTVGVLQILDGASVESNTFSAQPGGTVTINASQSVTIAGRDNTGASSRVSTATFFGGGDAGQISISAPTLTVEGGEISAFTGGGGAAGNILIEATDASLTGGAFVNSSTLGTGKGGTLMLHASQSVTVSGQDSTGFATTISSSSDGAGDAGRVSLSAPMVQIADNAFITTFAGSSGKAGEVGIEGSRINVTGGAHVDSSTVGIGPAGTVRLTATELINIAGHNSANQPSLITSGTADIGNAGQILITTPTLTITEGRISTATTGTGHAGEVTLQVGQLMATGGAVISSSSTGSASGNAGTIIVRGFGDPTALPTLVTISDSSMRTVAEGTGEGGSVTVGAVSTLTLTNATLSASVNNGLDIPGGNRGDITMIAPTIVMTASKVTAETTGTRTAGDILVRGNQIDLNSGTEISSSSIGNASGNAGGVTVQGMASPAQSLVVTGSSLLTSAEGTGSGGNLLLSAQQVTLDSATISATANSGKAGGILVNDTMTFAATNSALTTESTSGQGGTITISAGAGLETTLGNTIVSASVKGGNKQGGDVTIMGGQTLDLNGVAISAQSTGAGNAGDIVLTAGNTLQMAQSTVQTEASIASGGNITLQAPYLIYLTNSKVSSSVAGAEQTTGGNINIDPQFLILQNSQIIAQAFQGQGGNITINAGVFLPDSNSVVDASSQFGLNGTVVINSPIQSLSGTLAPLNQAYLAAAGLLPQRCAVRAQTGASSSLLIRGRDGLPQGPGGALRSAPAPLPPVRLAPGTSELSGRYPLLSRHPGEGLDTAGMASCQ